MLDDDIRFDWSDAWLSLMFLGLCTLLISLCCIQSFQVSLYDDEKLIDSLAYVGVNFEYMLSANKYRPWWTVINISGDTIMVEDSLVPPGSKITLPGEEIHIKGRSRSCDLYTQNKRIMLGRPNRVFGYKGVWRMGR